MFLSFLTAHNPALIDFAHFLLKRGQMVPNTYVLDLDAISDNAARLFALARAENLTLYAMTKQVGRNPWVAQTVIDQGFKGIVAVDFQEAMSFLNAKIPVAHVGNLVQIPDRLIAKVLSHRPEVISIFSLEKAARLSEEAQKQGFVQDVLLRVFDQKDVIYPSQEAGFALSELPKVVDALQKHPHIRIAGVTNFPCFLFDQATKKAAPTQNATTAQKAAECLQTLLPSHRLQVNLPSCNSLATLPLLKNFGGTHAEPGHALTGTSPDNPYEKEPLKPALVYVSEISHTHQGNSLCFGGGHYRRSHMENARVFVSGIAHDTKVLPMPQDAIDYHFALKGIFPVGAPVVMSFRTQIFVTRSRVAIIKGLSQGSPKCLGIWDTQGQKIEEC